jgi:hypothetical protein
MSVALAVDLRSEQKGRRHMGILEKIFGYDDEGNEPTVKELGQMLKESVVEGVMEEIFEHAPDEYYCGACRGWQSLKAPCEHLPIRK